MTKINFADGSTFESRIVCGLDIIETYSDEHKIGFWISIRHRQTKTFINTNLVSEEEFNSTPLARLRTIWKARRLDVILAMRKYLNAIADRN